MEINTNGLMNGNTCQSLMIINNPEATSISAAGHQIPMLLLGDIKIKLQENIIGIERIQLLSKASFSF